MPTSIAVLNQGLNVLKTRLRYVGLINPDGIELSGGTPAYTRQAVTWSEASAGSIVIPVDTTFDVPSGAVVAGWQIFDNSSGGVGFGIMRLTPEAHVTQDTYVLSSQLTELSVISS